MNNASPTCFTGTSISVQIMMQDADVVIQGEEERVIEITAKCGEKLKSI